MQKFKDGDKVRMLRKERIEAADHTENGEIYEVVEGTCGGGGGAILIDDKSGGASLLITKKELHAIEKVEPSAPKYRTDGRKTDDRIDDTEAQY